LHVVDPATGWADPPAQLVHAVAPLPAAYVPAPHAEQLVAPASA
jgi:hypothetical protein